MIEHLSDRQRKIVRLLVKQPDSSVSEMSEDLGVSTVTIRNDLKVLADRGVILRTRGGGQPAFHPAILEHQQCRSEEKTRIAAAAAERISDGDNIMIVAGTTTAMLPRFLLGKQVQVVTNSTLFLPFVRTNPGLRVIMIGGEFKPYAEALVGPDTLRSLERFHVSKAFLGTDGFTLEKGFTSHSVELAEVVRQMAEQAREKILLADSSKLGRSGFAHIMPMEKMDHLITDTQFPEEEVARFEKIGVHVQRV